MIKVDNLYAYTAIRTNCSMIGLERACKNMLGNVLSSSISNGIIPERVYDNCLVKPSLRILLRESGI